jgi:4-hydroxy-tetrahydrodipicolinate reductase
MVRVGVFGAGGRMGITVCAAVRADPELELVAAVDPAHAGEKVEPGGTVIGPGPETLLAAGAEVAVDFTVASAAAANVRWCAGHGVHAVVGTTGFTPEVLGEIETLFEAGPANCVVAPNFAIGAVLMMRFAELAAPWFDTVEIVELHHDGKLDAPSGTARLTAQRIAAARAGASPKGAGPEGASPKSASPEGDGSGKGPEPEQAGALVARGHEAAPGVQVHSVRLRGLVAHQEVLFGAAGQLLTVRHDSLERTSFMPGVVLAIKQVPSRRGFTLGLDALLGV